jgi:hypothetical protein
MRLLLGVLLSIVCGLPRPAAAQFLQPGTKLMDIPAYYSNIAVGLSADGNTAFVSWTCYSGCDAGTVYPFTRTNGLWAASSAIPVGGLPHGMIGWALGVSEDGNAFIVGALLNLINPGRECAWVFRRSGGAWTLEGSLLTGNSTVAISGDGNTAIAGGATSPFFGPVDSGTWVYTRAGGVWTQQAKLTSATGPAALSRDGNTAILAGDIYVRAAGVWAKQTSLSGPVTSVTISANGDTATAGNAVFTRTGGVWTQVAVLTGGGDAAAISRDGNTIVTAAGQTFRFTGGAWTQLPGALPGGAVALSGDGTTAVVGVTSAPNSGAVLVFVQAAAAAVPALSWWAVLGLTASLIAAGALRLSRTPRQTTRR